MHDATSKKYSIFTAQGTIQTRYIALSYQKAFIAAR